MIRTLNQSYCLLIIGGHHINVCNESFDFFYNSIQVLTCTINVSALVYYNLGSLVDLTSKIEWLFHTEP